MQQKKKSRKGYLISFASIIVFNFLLAFFLHIDPKIEYGWSYGDSHGALAISRFFISLFKEGCLIKAPLHTIGYSISWWVAFIFSLLFAIGFVFLLMSYDNRDDVMTDNSTEDTIYHLMANDE
jgi:hypothetical protein